MTAAAFRASYADFKLVKTRGVVQLIFEVPLHEADLAYQVVGGMPDAAAERWFAIARLNPKEVMPNTAELRQHKTPPASENSTTPARARKSWYEMTPAQQAGILCADKSFRKFMTLNTYYEADEPTVRQLVINYCEVDSRKKILLETRAAEKWRSLVSKYRTWQLAAQVVP